MRLRLFALIATIAVVLSCAGCADSGARRASTSVEPTSTAPVLLRREGDTLFAHMDAYTGPTLSAEVGTVRTLPSPSGAATLAVAFSMEIAKTATGPLEMMDVPFGVGVATRGGGTVLLTDVPREPGEHLRGSSQFGDMKFALPPDAQSVRFTFHVGPTVSEARRGVFLDIPLSDIPSVPQGQLGKFLPWGYSPPF